MDIYKQGDNELKHQTNQKDRPNLLIAKKADSF